MTHLPATDASRPPISPNAFILLAAWIASGVGLIRAPQAAGVFTFVFVILGWVLAVVAHEFGHAFIAQRQVGQHRIWRQRLGGEMEDGQGGD